MTNITLTNTTTDGCDRGNFYDGDSDGTLMDTTSIVVLVFLSMFMLFCGFCRPKAFHRQRVAAAAAAARRRLEAMKEEEPDDPELRAKVVKTILSEQQKKQHEQEGEGSSIDFVFDEEAQSLRWAASSTTNDATKTEEDDDDDREVCDDDDDSSRSASSSDGDEKNMKTCSICLDLFEEGDLIISSKPCSHVFHRDCVTEWCQKSDECPMCRQKMWQESLYDELMEAAIKEQEEAAKKATYDDDEEEETADSENGRKPSSLFDRVQRRVEDFLESS